MKHQKGKWLLGTIHTLREHLMGSENDHIVDGSENVPKHAYVIYEWSLHLKTRLKSYLEVDENIDNYNKDCD